MDDFKGALSGATLSEDSGQFGGALSGASLYDPNDEIEITPPDVSTGVPEVPIPDIVGPSSYMDRINPMETLKRDAMQGVGLGETVMAVASGLLATSLNGLLATGKTMYNMFAKDMSFEDALWDGSKMLDTVPSYQPMTAYGKDFTNEVGKVMDIPKQIGAVLGDDIIYYLNGQGQMMKFTPDMPQYGIKPLRVQDVFSPEYAENIRKSGIDTSKFIMGAIKSTVLNHLALDENFKKRIEKEYPDGSPLPPDLVGIIAAIIGIPTELWIWGKAFERVHGSPPKMKGMTPEQFRAREQVLKNMEDSGQVPPGTTDMFRNAVDKKAQEIVDNGYDDAQTPVEEKAAVTRLAKDASDVIQDPTMRDILGLTDEKIAESKALEETLNTRKKSAVDRAKLGTLENPTVFYKEQEPMLESWQDIANQAKKPIKLIEEGEETIFYPELQKEQIEFVTDPAVLERMKQAEELEKYAPEDEFANEQIYGNNQEVLDKIDKQIEENNRRYDEAQAKKEAERSKASPEDIAQMESIGKAVMDVERRVNVEGRKRFDELVRKGYSFEDARDQVVKEFPKKEELAKLDAEQRAIKKRYKITEKKETPSSVEKINKAQTPKKTKMSQTVKARGGKNYTTQKGIIKRLNRDYGGKWQDNYWIQGDAETGYWAERIPEVKNASAAAQKILDEIGLKNPDPRQIANAERVARMKSAQETETYLPNDDTGDAHQFTYEEKIFNLENALKRASREPDGLRVEYLKDQFKQLKDENVFTQAELDKLEGMDNDLIETNFDYPDTETAKLLGRELGIDEPHPTATVASEQAKGLVEFTKDLLDDEAGFISMFGEGSTDMVETLRRHIAAGLSERFYDRPNVRSETYHNIFVAIDDYRITQNLGAFDAQLIRVMLHDKIPNLETAKKISNYIEGKDVKLGPTETAMAEIIKEVYKQLGIELQAEGILNYFIDNYINHVIRPLKKKGAQYTTKQAISFIKARVRKEGVEGTLTIEKLKELGREKGFEVEEDIRTLLPMYFYYAKRAIARKRLGNYLVTAETPDGHKVMYPTDKVPEEVADQYVDMVDVSTIKKYSRFGRRSTGLEDPELVKERNILFRGDVSVHRDAWKQIENLMAEEKSAAITLWDSSRGFVKRLIMFNPLIHGLNVESNVLLSMGVFEYLGLRKGRPGRLAGMFGEANKAELNATMRRMVENGVQLEGLYNIGKRLAKDSMELRLDKMSMREWLNGIIDKPSRAINPVDLWGRVKTIGQLNDIILWDRIVKTGQVAIYRSLEAKYLRQGYSPKEAGKMAGMQANDYMGTIPKNWYTKKQRTFLRRLLFARDWNVGLWRSLTGAAPRDIGRSGLVPKPLRHEGISTEMMGGIKGKGNPFKGIKGQYREMLIRGAVYITTLNNAIQMALLAANDQEVRPIWQNEKGHRLDPDTGTVDAQGRKVYLRGWMFRQISEYAHLAAAAVEGDVDEALKIARNKLEPILNLIIGETFNIDYRNEPIRHPGATGPEKAVEMVRYAAESLTPVDTVFGKKGQVRNMWEVMAPLTGTFVRHGMPAGGDVVMANMLHDYYKWLDVKKYRNLVSSGNVEEMIRRGDWDGSLDYAISALYSGHITPGQFENLLRRNPQWGDALFGRIATPNGKLESNFQRFLNDMGEQEPDKFDSYYDKLQKVANEVNNKDRTIPETTKIDAKLQIFDNVMFKEGGYVFNEKDPGGETIYGISRNFNKDWPGWKRVDFLKRQGYDKYTLAEDGRLKQYAGEFYNQYWKDKEIDKINDPQLQEIMFNFMFNTPRGATSSARKALGIGTKGSSTISSDLQKGLNKLETQEQKREFMRRFSEEMKRYYNTNSPSSHLRGLHNRVEAAKAGLG